MRHSLVYVIGPRWGTQFVCRSAYGAAAHIYTRSTCRRSAYVQLLGGVVVSMGRWSCAAQLLAKCVVDGFPGDRFALPLDTGGGASPTRIGFSILFLRDLLRDTCKYGTAVPWVRFATLRVLTFSELRSKRVFSQLFFGDLLGSVDS